MFAQITNALPITTTLPVMTDNVALANFAISVVTPFVVAWIAVLTKRWLPHFPKLVLPLLAPFVGIAVAFLLNLVGLDVTQGIGAAVWGAVGVWVRELANQTSKMSTFRDDSVTSD